jgi:hypothetical protein
MVADNIVYSVTVIDLRSENVIGFRRTPAIFTKLEDAMFAVKNNLHDISDDSTYQYAVIEKTKLNVIRPNLENKSTQWWFRFNSASGEFVETIKPSTFLHQTGFGIG